MAKWNDTDVPLAYLITFRTYGTWLPGDARGSIDRYNNKYGGARVRPNATLTAQHAKKLKCEPVKLNAHQRRAVEEATKEVCKHRKWKLYAIPVRTNHIHVVVAAIADEDRVLNDFKSYATRKMRENGVWAHDHSPWVNKGSKRKLWNDEHIFRASDYVLNGQGDDLPDFL
jgi:REP element-mobilizing transposase RayT